VHFYEVGGLLIRRWVPAQRRSAMEVWNGEGWIRYPDGDHVARQGRRLNEIQALGLLHDTRHHMEGLPRLSDEEALSALRARLRRG